MDFPHAYIPKLHYTIPSSSPSDNMVFQIFYFYFVIITNFFTQALHSDLQFLPRKDLKPRATQAN